VIKNWLLKLLNSTGVKRVSSLCELHHSLFNIIISVFTLFVVLIYTGVTYRLYKTAQQQIELTVKPVLSISDCNQSQWFELENVGLYTALYAHIDDIDIKKDSIHIQFLKTPRYIKASQKVQIQVLINDLQMPEFVVNKPKTCKNQYKTKIHYKSVNGEMYYQVLSLEMQNGINIVSIEDIQTE
jgi:hypothetical protein